MELFIISYLALLLGGKTAIAETSSNIVTQDTSQGIAPFITSLIMVITLLLIIKREEVDLPISGPMTESEYEWLQDTLAYQA